MALEKAKVRQLLSEVRNTKGRASAVKAKELLAYVRSEKRGSYTARDSDSVSGSFMAVKKDGKPFKGVAQGPDKR